MLVLKFLILTMIGSKVILTMRLIHNMTYLVSLKSVFFPIAVMCSIILDAPGLVLTFTIQVGRVRGGVDNPAPSASHHLTK